MIDGIRLLLDINRDIQAIAQVLHDQGHDVGLHNIASRTSELEDFIASNPHTYATDEAPQPGQPVERTGDQQSEGAGAKPGATVTDGPQNLAPPPTDTLPQARPEDGGD